MTGRSRLWLVALVLAVVSAAGTFFGLERSAAGGRTGEASVTRSTLARGTIRLLVRNHSGERVRIAQAIVNDAFVDFTGPLSALEPGEEAWVTVSYPWIEGEAYEIELLTSTGAAILYELEDAGPG